MHRASYCVFGLWLLLLAISGCNSRDDQSPSSADSDAIGSMGTESADRSAGRRRRSLLEDIDDNQDGKISPGEATADIRDAFSEIDTDNDGFVVQEELTAYAQRLAQAHRMTKADEQAAIAMLERVGGSFERAPGGSGPLGPIAAITLADTTATNDDLALLTKLSELFEIRLNSQGLDDGCFVHLPRMRDLVFVRLIGRQFSDEGVKQISSMRQLRKLELTDTSVGSEGLLALSKLPNLETLLLANQELGPEEVEALREFQAIYEIRFNDCQITADQLAELRRALPDCEIVVGPGQPSPEAEDAPAGEAQLPQSDDASR